MEAIEITSAWEISKYHNFEQITEISVNLKD